MARHDGRADDELRKVELTLDYLQNPLATVVIHMGRTKVLCAANVDDKVPQFLKGRGEGWVTGEYCMIPAATDRRMTREIHSGRPGGRTMEIQRLIGRSLRAVVDRKALGDRTLWVDCEVLEADGGTRTAAITGGFVAMALALIRLRKQGKITRPVLTASMAAISVGIVDGTPRLDLDFVEDSAADVDMNIVRTNDGRYIELQGTAEATPFPRAQLDAMLALADKGVDELQAAQREALGPDLDSILIG